MDPSSPCGSLKFTNAVFSPPGFLDIDTDTETTGLLKVLKIPDWDTKQEQAQVVTIDINLDFADNSATHLRASHPDTFKA